MVSKYVGCAELKKTELEASVSLGLTLEKLKFLLDTLSFTNLLAPNLFPNVLMRVSRIFVVSKPALLEE